VPPRDGFQPRIAPGRRQEFFITQNQERFGLQGARRVDLRRASIAAIATTSL
jgi:hypothetical protein